MEVQFLAQKSPQPMICLQIKVSSLGRQLSVAFDGQLPSVPILMDQANARPFQRFYLQHVQEPAERECSLKICADKAFISPALARA
jgi:hypothetical protein